MPRRLEGRELGITWEPPTIVVAPGAFAMPIGPVFSDFAESAHFLLETVGEDVIRTIPRFFYKYRGVEKIAEDKPVERVLLLAERFSGTSAFAHGLAFCQAVEAICGIDVPPRALGLRTVFAELERLRYHAAVITGICNSTALAVATAQAALIEETLLRLSCDVTRHRYLFGLVKPGGVSHDLSDETRTSLAESVGIVARRLHDLHQMLRYSSSFLDRLEEVGIINTEKARSLRARRSELHAHRGSRATFASCSLTPDMNLPVLSCPSNMRATVTRGCASSSTRPSNRPPSCAISCLRCLKGWSARMTSCGVPALPSARSRRPAGAAFHWLRLNQDGTVARWRITPPSFTNWHGFHLAAEKFAFQDFPIILASFGLSNAECDR